MTFALGLMVAAVALFSLFLSPLSKHSASFFDGRSAADRPPGLLTLTLSQVTTWIFARSLLNAAILGFYYGIWGTLAYACYYLSFLTGGRIVDSLRFEHGYDSVQAFLRDRFGVWGTHCYNFVVGLRLVSEVFANLLVIGILFGIAGSQSYVLAVIGVAAVTLLYSMLGGLHASLKTDFLQMLLFILLLAFLSVLMLLQGHYQFELLTFKPLEFSNPGVVLIVVALLQVWSYPLHDPVMMDRGFLADRDTTRRSFLHAAWISIFCIVLFGSFGVIAGVQAAEGSSMNETLALLFGDQAMLMFQFALVISAMSTLDSTLSSSARLVTVNNPLLQPSLRNGRLVMALFMLAGVALVFLGNKDLFSAVAVSGTASMYLAPVIFFSIWGRIERIPLWSYLGSFALGIGAAVLYFTESSGYSAWLGEAHKYTKLLWLSLTVLLGGSLLFWLGSRCSGNLRSIPESA